MIVVADTSPLNYLLQIGLVDLLQLLYGHVSISNAVLTEMHAPKAPKIVQAWAAALPGWVDVQQPTCPYSNDLMQLDLGERSAIELAMILQADRILMDERRGALVAESLGLRVTGTLGILRDAHQARLVNARQAYGRLKSETNFRDSRTVAQVFLDSLTDRI